MARRFPSTESNRFSITWWHSLRPATQTYRHCCRRARIVHSPLSHIRAIEADSIHILREVAADFSRPVMLYSIGKETSVMRRLAQKAFYPDRPTFPLLHSESTYKFRE